MNRPSLHLTRANCNERGEAHELVFVEGERVCFRCDARPPSDLREAGRFAWSERAPRAMPPKPAPVGAAASLPSQPMRRP